MISVHFPKCSHAAHFLIALAAVALAPIAVQAEEPENECECAATVSPVLVANAAVAELTEARIAGAIRTGQDQPKLLSKYLDLVEHDPEVPLEDPAEKLSLAELYFLNFRPREANALFDGLLERDDLIGRLAWQRAMQIRMQAFDRPEEVQAMLASYSARFDASEYDVFGTTQQVFNFARNEFAAENASAAVDLVLEHIEATPATGPFRAFSIYRFFPEQLAASGRQDEVKRALAGKLEQLEQLRVRWETEQLTRTIAEELQVRSSVPQWYWQQQRIAPATSVRQARIEQLSELIEQLTQYLEGG